MNFTTAQKQALLFMLSVILLAISYRMVNQYFFPPPAYDFSTFNQQYLARYDSIRQQLYQDSLAALQPAPVEAQRMSSSSLQSVAATASPGIININTAGIDELIRLPRIGPKTAARIISWRLENGVFKVKKDIQKVKGIGPKTYRKLKQLIRVD